MKNVPKKVITMVMAIAICCSIMTVSAYASEKTDGVITGTHVVSQETRSATVFILNEQGNFSSSKTITYSAPKTAWYTVTLASTDYTSVRQSRGSSASSMIMATINSSTNPKNTYQQRCYLVKGQVMTIQFTNLSSSNSLHYVAMVHETYS